MLYYLTARVLNTVSGGAKRQLPALFYRDRPGRAAPEEKAAFLNRRLRYKNPASGAEFEKSFTELRQGFYNLFTDYLRPLEKTLADNSESPGAAERWEKLLPVFSGWQPFSPDTGQPIRGIPVSEDPIHRMSYFDIRPFVEVWGS